MKKIESGVPDVQLYISLQPYLISTMALGIGSGVVTQILGDLTSQNSPV